MKLIVRLLTVVVLFITAQASAQCPTGYTQAQLNWDNLDYFSYTGNYTSASGYLSSNSMSKTQNFAFGTQRVTITHNYADANSLGENTNNTAETGAYGTGADIQFIGNGVITVTFETAVQNVKFSLFDIDKSQVATVTAVNGALPQIITMNEISSSPTLSIAGSGTTTAIATSTSTTVANTNNNGTVNIDITGPITSFTITITATSTCTGGGCGTGGTEDGSFYVSDITACTAGTFPTGYYAVSKPFTNQPGYILHSFDSAVYMLNPANGVTKLLFKDATGLGRINSMGYDPYNKILYYVYSLTSAGNNKKLMKYDFTTETISTVLTDITTIGIPVTSTSGVESGGAGFYNGSFYLGIETSNSGRTSNREAVIWRIDFDASNVPYRCSQVYATPVDNGSGTLLHDWSDFALSNGTLIDFDGAGVTTQTDVMQVNMMTGTTTNYPLPSGWTPGQLSVDWNEVIYQIYATSTAPTVVPYVAVYNNNGTIGTRTNITSTPAYTPAIPSIGDAAEAFKPKVDFGDAPSSYDPAAGDPAVHEMDSTIHIGANVDREWSKTGSATLANTDSYDDGPSYVSVFNPAVNYFYQVVKVYNHTGANATLIGWLDYNGNGVFDASEGVTYTIPSSTALQTVNMLWASITSPLVNGTYTYLRLRMTSTSNGMTTANPTGYFANGEVEDYRVAVNSFPLTSTLLSFDAEKTAKHSVRLAWDATNEVAGLAYEVQKSSDLQNWKTFAVKSKGNSASNSYVLTDANPFEKITYYRLQIKNPDQSLQYSEVRQVVFNEPSVITIYPNPASDRIMVTLKSCATNDGSLVMYDATGRVVLQEKLNINKGDNYIPVMFEGRMPNGVYTLQLVNGTEKLTNRILIKN